MVCFDCCSFFEALKAYSFCIPGWSDIRTKETVEELLSKIKNNKNYLKSVCGLTISTCFSGIKLKWLFENIPEIRDAISENVVHFGTLDTWILWNLTGGLNNGIHLTDVTNASRTMLMSLEKLQWDRRLCNFFKIPMTLLPKIKTCSEVLGYVHDGPLSGVPIASCMGDQNAALLGQMCLKSGQAKCTYEDGCYLLVNTGQEIIDSDHGLLSTVAFQLGPNEKPFYALEGFVANAGSSIHWLRDNLKMNTEINQNLSTSYLGNFNVSDTKTDVVFIPALSGLYSPHWKHEARGMLMGLTSGTTSQQITLAALEAICFQTRELLDSLRLDCLTWPVLNKLLVGGEFSDKNHTLLQMLSDLCGITIERPQTTSSACLGVIIAAGLTMKVITLEHCLNMFPPPSDYFHPTISETHRDLKYRKWKFAIQKCLKWNEISDAEVIKQIQEKDPNLAIQSSIPASIFFFSTFAILTIAQFFKNSKVF